MLEWAEFTFFAYIADQIANLFFLLDEPNIARLKMYAIFATSYVMRPFGAIFFGNIGDKYGRKPAMIGSLALMAIATFSIGILPTYNTIGIIAPVLLMIFRMLQGVAVAGEFSGSAVLLTEQVVNNQFLAGAWTACAAAGGMAIGSIAATILALKVIPLWCWRLPFLLSAIIALIAIYLRINMDETKVFNLAKQEKKLFASPIKAAWKYNKKGLLATIGFSTFISVFVYTGNIYYKNMAINIGNIPPYIAAAIITAGMLLATLLIPIFAYLADLTNGYKICIFGLILAIILSPLMMSFAISGQIFYVIVGQMIYAIIDAMVSATMFTLLLQKFQTGTKYSGSGIAWSITTAIFGGSALMVNEFFIKYFKQLTAPGIYIAISALCCLIIIIVTRNSAINSNVVLVK